MIELAVTFLGYSCIFSLIGTLTGVKMDTALKCTTISPQVCEAVLPL